MQFRLNDETPERPLHVLIVRVGAMGDVLHGLPAVAALRARIPNCVIGWAVEPRWKSLLVTDGEDGMPIVDHVHEVPTSEWKLSPLSYGTVSDVARLRREMKAVQYDLCVDLQGSIRSAMIGRMAGATDYLGPRHPREKPAAWLYKQRVTVEAAHVIEQACELIETALTDSWDPAEVLRPARVTLPVDAAAERWCDAQLAELGADEHGFVLLAPTAGWGAKQWPVEKYRQLAGRLSAEGYRVLVNAGSAADRAVTNAVADGAPTTVVVCEIPQLVALTRRAKLVVGGDTGPVHLAAALGRPVVGLYGPTDPRRNGPYFPGAPVRVLRHASSRSDHARHAVTESGLAKITEDEVVAAALDLLREVKGNG